MINKHRRPSGAWILRYLEVEEGEEVTRDLVRGFSRGLRRGWARGEALSVLTVLRARGIHVPAERSREILGCTDRDTLGTWLYRAATARSCQDLDEVSTPG
jgi:hypothetical protein